MSNNALPLERPIPAASRERPIGHAYGFYNADMIAKLICILRVVHNFALIDEKKRLTPVQQLGALDRRLSLQDIVDYQAHAQV